MLVCFNLQRTLFSMQLQKRVDPIQYESQRKLSNFCVIFWILVIDGLLPLSWLSLAYYKVHKVSLGECEKSSREIDMTFITEHG